ncbi:DinB family protein [Pseudoneobacillus sp. C159]
MVFNEMELLNTRNRLKEEISTLSFEEFNWKPGQDTWSIAQVCHHLFLVESVFSDAIAYSLKRNNSSKSEQKKMTNILDRSKKIVAPEIVHPKSESFTVQQIDDLLTQSRNKLLTIIHTLKDPTVLLEHSAKHPLYGPLPLNQWIDLISLHEQRHIEQMEEIKTRFGNQ